MSEDLDQKIRERAYALWEEEGRPAGRHEAHWHEAARDLAPVEAEVAPTAKPVKTSTRRKTAAAPPAEAPAPVAKAPRKPRAAKAKTA